MHLLLKSRQCGRCSACSVTRPQQCAFSWACAASSVSRASPCLIVRPPPNALRPLYPFGNEYNYDWYDMGANGLVNIAAMVALMLQCSM